MKRVTGRLLEAALDWLFPPSCMSCKQILPMQKSIWRRDKLCGDCRILFEKLEPPCCPRCGHPQDESAVYCSACHNKKFAFTGSRAMFPYKGIIRDIIHGVKFKSNKRAAVGLGKLWASSVDDFPPADFLAPVPMYPKKIRKRGFNQSEVLAKELSAEFKIPLAKNLLKRTKDTPPQSGLSIREREENVRGVFTVNKNFNIKGKRIILIDDIFTTGASLNSCAEALIKAGSENVSCMTLSITVKDKNNCY